MLRIFQLVEGKICSPPINADSMPSLPAISTVQSLPEECDAKSGRVIVEVGLPSRVTGPTVGCPVVSKIGGNGTYPTSDN